MLDPLDFYAVRPVPAPADKRVAVIAIGGGGGACVSPIGVARPFEREEARAP